jgi:hypothetical protein
MAGRGSTPRQVFGVGPIWIQIAPNTSEQRAKRPRTEGTLAASTSVPLDLRPSRETPPKKLFWVPVRGRAGGLIGRERIGVLEVSLESHSTLANRKQSCFSCCCCCSQSWRSRSSRIGSSLTAMNRGGPPAPLRSLQAGESSQQAESHRGRRPVGPTSANIPRPK